MRIASTTLVLALCFTIAPTALATEMSWTFQAVDENPAGQYGHVGIAMRTNATWPTVFYGGTYSSPGMDNQVVASSLTPVGWMPSGVGSMFDRTYIRTATGHDGRVGAVYFANGGITMAQSSPLGWQTQLAGGLPHGPDYRFAPDLAYLSGDRPVVAYSEGDELIVRAHDGAAWNTDVVHFDQPQHPDYGDSATLAVDSQDSIGVAYAQGNCAFLAYRGPLVGGWMGTQVAEVGGGITHLSLAFGANDVPGLAVLDDNHQLHYADFDISLGQWVVESIAADVDSERVNLAFDSQGNPGLSYVSEDPDSHEPAIFYSYRDESGWAKAMLPIGLDDPSQLMVGPAAETDAALAFDNDDLPVIAYYGEDNQVLLAYDPVVPEPGTFVFVVLGSAFAMRRRRGA